MFYSMARDGLPETYETRRVLHGRAACLGRIHLHAQLGAFSERVFHSHGGTPIVGWFILWKIRN
jgi:hypothetical protein